MSIDTEKIVNKARQTYFSMLEAAAVTQTVVSVVATSTRIAVYAPEYGEDKEYSLETFADFFLPLAKSASDEDPSKMVYVCEYHFHPFDYNRDDCVLTLMSCSDAAGKTEGEKAGWAFVKEKKPRFAFNTIIPDWVLGPVVNPTPGVYSSVSVTRGFFEGDPASPLPLFMNPAGYANDVRDVAVLHVAALLDISTNGERLWAMGHQFHLNDLLKIWREAFPDKVASIPKDLDFPPPSRQIVDRSKSELLLKQFAGRSWYPLKDSVIDTIILNSHLDTLTVESKDA